MLYNPHLIFKKLFMSSKTLSIIILILLLVVAGFFFAAFLLSRKENRPLGEVLFDIAPFGELLQDIPFGGEAPLGEIGGEAPPEGVGITPETLPDLYKISAAPVSGVTAFLRDGTEYVRYALLETGHIYEYGATTTERTRVTNTTAPGIKEIFWGKNGATAVVRYLDEENVIKTYLGRVVLASEKENPGESSGILYGDFLADNIKEMTVSPEKDRFFYLLPTGNSVFGFIAGFDEKEGVEKRVFDFPFTEWLVSWPKNGIVVLATKPSASTDGFAYTLDIATGAMKKIIGDGIKGLTVRPSPDMASVLYSRGLRNRIDTFLFDTKTAVVKNFPVVTLSLKCVWGKKAAEMVYCGVPETLPEGHFPDDWFQGRVSFSDTVWRIDTKTNTPERISFLEVDAKEAVDVVEPVLSPNDDFLFFINKKDSSLWSLKITH